MRSPTGGFSFSDFYLTGGLGAKTPICAKPIPVRTLKKKYLVLQEYRAPLCATFLALFTCTRAPNDVVSEEVDFFGSEKLYGTEIDK